MSKKILLVPAFAVLAASLAPLAASAATANTTISSAVAPVISVFTTSGTVNVNVLPTTAGAQTTASDTVTVSHNGSAGYTLTLNDADANTSLVSGANTIAASTGTQAAPTALSAGRWGYRVDGVGTFGAGPTAATSNTAIGAVTYAGVTATAQTLKTTSTTANNDVTTVWYSVAANTSQPSGTYTDVVTYTATTN